jgi:hypothetical protein
MGVAEWGDKFAFQPAILGELDLSKSPKLGTQSFLGRQEKATRIAITEQPIL